MSLTNRCRQFGPAALSLLSDLRRSAEEMVIRTKDTSGLASCLTKGAARFRALGDRPIWSSYRDGVAIADFIDRAVEEIQAGTITQSTANELWGIFAPTCDWDDCVGDSTLGQKIFEVIETDLNYAK